MDQKKILRFDTLELECKKQTDKLSRKESYKVRSGSIKVIDNSHSKPNVDWKKRNELIFPLVSGSINDLMEAYKVDKTSLGVIKPKELIDFIKTEPLKTYEREGWSFTKTLDGEKIPTIIKIPHIFKYKFTCNCCQKDDKDHEMQCEDWELFEAYRKW